MCLCRLFTGVARGQNGNMFISDAKTRTLRCLPLGEKDSEAKRKAYEFLIKGRMLGVRRDRLRRSVQPI